MHHYPPRDCFGGVEQRLGLLQLQASYVYATVLGRKLQVGREVYRPAHVAKNHQEASCFVAVQTSAHVHTSACMACHHMVVLQQL